jgi:TetR/AcrR family transcriptional regulator
VSAEPLLGAPRSGANAPAVHVRVSNADRNLKSRTAILAAAEQIMREEGYAAVSSRKIAARAGLKSQLVHYYFRTMDELFQELLRRVEEQFFLRLAQAVAAPRALRAVWELCKDADGPGLTNEFVAMAIHHEGLRSEIARSAERTRSIIVAQLERLLTDNAISQDAWSPLALAVMIDGTARLLVADAVLGTSMGHREAIALIERQITSLEQGTRPG